MIKQERLQGKEFLSVEDFFSRTYINFPENVMFVDGNKLTIEEGRNLFDDLFPEEKIKREQLVFKKIQPFIYHFKEVSHNYFKFDEFTEELFFNEFIKKFNLITIHNGYLVGYDRKTGEEKFFHRYAFEKKSGLKIGRNHIHHVNENKKDNRICNLDKMTPEQHHNLHEENYEEEAEDRRYDNAFDTWCTKKYGHVCGSYQQEFDEWLYDKETGRW